MLSDARSAIARGDIPLALIYFKNAANADPRNGYVRAQLGVAELKAQNFPEAETQLRQARIDRAPDEVVLPALFTAMIARQKFREIVAEFSNPGAHSQDKAAADILKARAVSLQQLAQPQEAAAEMDLSLSYRRDIVGLLTRARIAQEQQDAGTAQRLADEALKLDPRSLDALVFQISLALQSQNSGRALTLAEGLVQFHPNDLAARSARIEVYLKMNMDAKAKPEVDAILAAHPNLPSASYYRALLLARARRVKDAWGIAETLSPEFVQSQPAIALTVAEMAIANGNLETGGAILAASLTKHPDDSRVRLRLAEIRLRQNSAENALTVLSPLKDSNDPRVASLTAETYLKLHRWSEALTFLEKATSAPGSNPLLKQQLAATELKVGQGDAAISDLFELAAQHPENMEVSGQLIAALTRLKRFDDALKTAAALAKALPKSPAPEFYKGEIFFAKGDLDGAMASFNASLRNDTGFVPSLYYRAGVFEVRGQFAEADRDLQQIISHDPKNVQALVKDAEIALRSKRDNDVPKLLGRAIAVSPENPVPRIALTNFYMAKGNMNAARSADNDLLRVSPSSTEGLAMAGAIQWATGEKSKTVETYRRLDALVPRSLGVKLLLSQALAGTGDKKAAENVLEDAIRDNPDSIQPRRALIVLRSSMGNGAGAVEVANDYATGHNSTDADLLLADAFVHNNQNDKAIGVLTKSLAARPDKHTVISLANVLVTSNRADEARKPLAAWVESHAQDVDVRRQFALLLMQLGDNANATTQYEIVIKSSPGDADSLNNLGWLIQKDDPKRAIQLVAHAADLSPASADILDTLGWLKFAQKDVAGALQLIQKAHGLRKSDAEISYHLAVVLDRAGKRSEAKTLLESIVGNGTRFADLANAQRLIAAWH
jgi:putative PEP-CTERM system TPR-repeat lipoprotein